MCPLTNTPIKIKHSFPALEHLYHIRPAFPSPPSFSRLLTPPSPPSSYLFSLLAFYSVIRNKCNFRSRALRNSFTDAYSLLILSHQPGGCLSTRSRLEKYNTGSFQRCPWTRKVRRFVPNHPTCVLNYLYFQGIYAFNAFTLSIFTHSNKLWPFISALLCTFSFLSMQ